VTRCWSEVLNDERHKLLPNHTAEVVIKKFTADGKVSYGPAAIAASGGTYEVTMDYMKYRVEPVYEESTNRCLGMGRVGVGLRIRANFVTKNASLDVGSPLAIGIAAKAGSLRGSITVDVIGLDSKDVTMMVPITSEINETSIQNAIQALASIKAKLHENVEIVPHLVAIRRAAPDVPRDAIQKSLTMLKPPDEADGVHRVPQSKRASGSL